MLVKHLVFVMFFKGHLWSLSLCGFLKSRIFQLQYHEASPWHTHKQLSSFVNDRSDIWVSSFVSWPAHAWLYPCVRLVHVYTHGLHVDNGHVCACVWILSWFTSCANSPVCNARPLELYMWRGTFSRKWECTYTCTVNIFHSKISSFFLAVHVQWLCRTCENCVFTSRVWMQCFGV